MYNLNVSLLVSAEENKRKHVFLFSDSDDHTPETNLFGQTEQTRKAVWEATGKLFVGRNGQNIKFVLL